MAFDLGDYKDVAERLTDLRTRFPDATLQSEIVTLPEAFADKFLAVRATVYRTADDTAPATGLAWEPVPGQTPYTKNSELQNAETSAWGRAIIAALASESQKIASRQEVESRQAERETPVKEQPVKETPTFNAAQWLAIASKTFTDWTEDERKAAGKSAVAELKPSKPMTQKEASAVHDHMAKAYYADHSEELF